MGSEGWNIAESRGVRGGIYFSRVELELRSYKGIMGLRQQVPLKRRTRYGVFLFTE